MERGLGGLIGNVTQFAVSRETTIAGLQGILLQLLVRRAEILVQPLNHEVRIFLCMKESHLNFPPLRSLPPVVSEASSWTMP